jgi:hypothetical protein
VLVLLAGAGIVAVPGPGHATSGRDDTTWLQARLDAGGRIFLPKLADGECYETRGLWVSHNGTRIGSNGACIVYLGPGPTRLASSDGDPIASNAIFIVNRSTGHGPPPRGVAISDLTLIVPVGTDGYGVIVAGTHVSIVDLDVDGVPTDGITITGRNNGLGYAGPVLVRNSLIRGAKRNGISVIAGRDVTIDGNTITGVGLVGMQDPELGPWAGIDLEPDVASYPIDRVAMTGNTIVGNGGPGVLIALVTATGPPKVARQITLSANTIAFNSVTTGEFLRGGVCLQGGQSDGQGTLRLVANEIANNGGYGLCSDAAGFDMRVALSCNRLHDNADGESQWGEIANAGSAAADEPARGALGCG